MKIIPWLSSLPEKLIASLILCIGVIVSGGALLVSCEAAKSETTSAVQYTEKEILKRGQYLVNTTGCHDCHSPKIMTPNGPEPDPERLLSGYPADVFLPVINKNAMKDWILFNPDLTAIAGPWGVSFAANISSDETGIGNWTEEQFFTTIREGTYKGLKGSRPLLPPMPWQVYRNMTDDDLKAIFAYLKSTKPVSNVVPTPIAPDRIP
jgi:hypothetical protein